MVGEPTLVGRVRHLLTGAFEDAAALVVLGQHVGVTGAQPQRRLALPLLLEPLDRAELVVAVLIGEQPHRAARLRRGELLGVAGQQDLRALPGGDVLDRGQVRGRHHRCLVDHQQVTAAAPADARGSGRCP